MDFDDFLTALTNLIGDKLSQLTADQYEQALTSAFNDQWATEPVFDNSLVFTSSAWQYALPATITAVSGVYIERDTSQFPEEISTELWEVVDGKLQFNNKARWTLTDTYPLWLRGRYKVGVNDTITDAGLQEYIQALSGWYALRNLSYARAFSFLVNDTTMADIASIKNQVLQEVLMWRQQLGTEFQGA